MTVERVPPKAPDACPSRMRIGPVEWVCVKKKGHRSIHRVDGPIVFQDPRTGMTVIVERSVEWEERV